MSDIISTSALLEAEILTVLRNIMKNESLTSTDNFFDIGGNSKLAMQFVTTLEKKYPQITLRRIFQYQTVKELAQYAAFNSENDIQEIIKSIQQVIEQTELFFMEENCLAGKEQYEKEASQIKIMGEKEYQNIFVTGATGFLGSHLVKELLLNTKSNLYLLVRGKDVQTCKERVYQKWKIYFKEQDYYQDYKSRIHIVNGDVSSPKMGMNAVQYNTLAQQIDCIIHSAAVVSHVETWEKYQKCNVKGTENLLKFASYIKKKDFNFISTIATEFTEERCITKKIFTEDDTLEEQKAKVLYVQSKIECEKMVRAYAKKNIQVKIFRMGFLIQSHETGIFQENAEKNAFFGILHILYKMKVFPAVRQKIIDVTYIDEAAKAVVLLFNKIDNLGTYHILNPKRVSILELAEQLGTGKPELAIYEPEKFVSYLSENQESLRSMLDRLAIMLMAELNINFGIFAVSMNQKTMAALNQLGFTWSLLDKKAVNDMKGILEGMSKKENR